MGRDPAIVKIRKRKLNARQTHQSVAMGFLTPEHSLLVKQKRNKLSAASFMTGSRLTRRTLIQLIHQMGLPPNNRNDQKQDNRSYQKQDNRNDQKQDNRSYQKQDNRNDQKQDNRSYQTTEMTRSRTTEVTRSRTTEMTRSRTTEVTRQQK